MAGTMPMRSMWPAWETGQRCRVHTIRTQSAIRHGIGITARRQIVQRDDMTDLQAVIMNDDAVDDELQDGLFVGEGGLVQPAADAFAQGRQISQNLLCPGALAV